MSSPIALIIGAGSNVGRGVALRLKQEGYKIAVGSRRPNVAEAEKNGFLPVSVDATDSGSIDNAFKVVRESYGSAPNVVVFNPAVYVPPPTSGDPLSVAVSTAKEVANLEVGLFAAAKQALSGFRSLAQANALPKVFIFTGNSLPFLPIAPAPFNDFFVLSWQKRTAAYFLELFAGSYKKEGFRFYFADENKADGTTAGREVSGEAHGIAYWDLVQKNEQDNWYYRFGNDGKELPGRDQL